jgi:hypothetical protein
MGIGRAGINMIHKTRRKELFILIFCLVLGFSLRFYTFDHKSLWIDEVHTFNDSREGLKGQIKYFKDRPVDFFHPPLFYILTHLFYPYEKPERDLRIIPLIFGTLSIPMIYLLSRLFSPPIAIPCTLSLIFSAYHISFSQDGRSYSLLIFLGMAGLYFFLRYLKTYKMRDLLLVAFFFVILFYTSYSSIPFIVLSQIFWFYQMGEDHKKFNFSSFLILNMTILLLCAPWIIFLLLNYKGQPILEAVSVEELGSFWDIISWIFNDWTPLAPLTVISIILLGLFPILSKNRRKALILLTVVFLPIVGLYLVCKTFNIRHYFSSRYVINFLPLFFISIFLSLNSLEVKLERWNRILQFRLLFIILFIASNMTILPLYYRSEKQDFRGLVSYLEGQLQDGDKIYVKSIAYIPGILHYFKVYPKSRYYNYPVWFDNSSNEIVARLSLVGQNKKFTIHYSNSCCAQYVEDGNRLWIVVGKPAVKEIKENTPSVLKGFFDGSFSNFRRFPEDASMYLFLWDPKSLEGKGIDIAIE